MNENLFKQYGRKQRVQYSEESFQFGMSFTNTPLNTGFVKELINFDMQDKGEMLVPRAGIQTESVSSKGTDSCNTIIDGQFCALENTNKHQVVLGDTSALTAITSNLYKGRCKVDTINAEPATVGRPVNLIEDVAYLPKVSSAFIDVGFIQPTKAEIHNLAVTPSTLAKNVGAFAFNNKYYTFNQANKKLAQTTYKNGKFEFEDLTPTEISPKEAMTWGYNMLQTNAYDFSNRVGTGTVQLLGLLPYNKDNALVLSPKLNETVLFKCFYSSPANTYEIKWEWKEQMGTEWTQFKKESLAMTALPTVSAELSIPARDIIVRITFTKQGETSPEQVMSMSVRTESNTQVQSENLKPINYDLSRCEGMSYWRNRLVVYGVPEDRTLLFLSEVNDPAYFPYPNNVDIFDEPIVNVMPFLDNLLVFTTTKLFMLTLLTDGMTWTKKQIQANLDIKEWDKHLTQQVKNMVFFKSGNYYYMVVPSLKTGDLVVTTISKNIERFLDDFKENIDRIVKLIYNYDRELQLVHYFNFLDYEDVHNTYVFKTVMGKYINVVLLYNTMSRSWRIHIYESASVIQSYKQDATTKGTLIGLLEDGVQFLRFKKQDAKDFYIDNNYNVVIPEFTNYQMIDTGYREHNTDYNKRYREVQLKFNNTSRKTLRFSSDFFIDGDMRLDLYDYKVVQNTDPLDPRYGIITVEKDPIPRIVLPGVTTLAKSKDVSNAWQMGVSGFPDIFLWKVRIPVSGKGMTPRLRFVSYNPENFELLNITWVHRMMNSR